MNIFRRTKILYSPCPSLAGMDMPLCRQVEHRDASLVTGCQVRIHSKRGGLSLTKSQSVSTFDREKRERRHCVSRKPTLTVEVDLLACYGRGQQ